MRSMILVVLALLTEAILSSAASAEPSRAASACHAKASRTIVENHFGRAVLNHEELFACPRAAPPFFLDYQYRPRVSSSPAGGVTRVALNRGAFMVTDEGVGGEHDGDSVAIRVVDVWSHRTRFSYGEYYPVDRVPVTGAAALCGNGRAAFIFEHRRSVGQGPQRDFQVRLSRARRTVLLARGSAIDPTSLTASDRELRWRDGVIPRATRVDCPSPRQAVAVPRLTVDEVFG